MDELTHVKNISKDVANAKTAKLPRSGKDLPQHVRPGNANDNPGLSSAIPGNTDTSPASDISSADRLSQGSLDSMLARLNRHIQDERRDLEFELMNEGSLMVVRVSDRHTGELIRQIPEKEVVDLARKLNAMEPLQLFNALV